MVAVLLALAASASWGVSDFLGGLTSRRLSLPAVMGVMMPVGLVAIGVIVLGRWQALPGTGAILWALLSGVLGAAGIASLYKGMTVGQMGVVAPISASAPLIPIAVGLVRGDHPSALQSAGIGLAVVGMVFASRERVEGSRRGRIAKGAAFGVISATTFGVAFIAIDEASTADPYWATLFVRIGAVAAVLVVVLAMRSEVRAPRSLWPVLVIVSFLDIGGTLLFAISTTKGLLSIVSAIICLVPVIVALLARGFLQERLEQVQLAGAAIAIAGVACISAG